MTVRLLSTMALAGVLEAFGRECETSRGMRFETVFAPTMHLLERIRSGERADIAILTEEGIEQLVAERVLERRTDLARSFVGVAVRVGAPHPDILSRDAFVATLLAARSVAMSMAGASGIIMTGLLERLGIAEAVRSKSIILASGYTAELAASGEAEIAIQQVSELMVVPGVEIVGRLPSEFGGETVFSAALFREAAARDAGRALIAALADPARDALYISCGLEPTGTSAPIQA